MDITPKLVPIPLGWIYRTLGWIYKIRTEWKLLVNSERISDGNKAWRNLREYAQRWLWYARKGG